MPGENIKITLSNCSSGYKNEVANIALLENINLTIRKGELVALIGRNGSGKTTLLKTMAGLLPLLAGTIRYDNISLGEMNANELAKIMGFHSALIPENQEMIVEDLVRLGRYPYTNLFGMLNSLDSEFINNAMIECGIINLRRKKLGQLSDGERQRAMLARVFAQDTDFMLLDEPTSHLDIPNKYEILNLLQNLTHKGKTILFTTHDLNLAAAYCDRLWLIHRHSIIEGAPEDLFLGSELKEQFETDKLLFDKDTGEFKPFRSTPFEVCLESETNCKTAFRWTRKALQRKGIRVIDPINRPDSIKFFISISKEKDTFVWNLVYHNQRFRIPSIYKLVSKLEILFKNDFN